MSNSSKSHVATPSSAHPNSNIIYELAIGILKSNGYALQETSRLTRNPKQNFALLLADTNKQIRDFHNPEPKGLDDPVWISYQAHLRARKMLNSMSEIKDLIKVVGNMKLTSSEQYEAIQEQDK